MTALSVHRVGLGMRMGIGERSASMRRRRRLAATPPQRSI
jgi:hypothetical protein